MILLRPTRATSVDVANIGTHEAAKEDVADSFARAKQFLAQIEPVLPGITAKYPPGKATVKCWAD